MSIAYTYSPKNFKLVGTVKLQKNPIRLGEWLVPSNATTTPPPTGYDETKTPAYNPASGSWYLVTSDYADNLEKNKAELVSVYGTPLYELDQNGNYVERDSAIVDAEDAERNKVYLEADLKRNMDTNIINKALEITKASSVESASAFFQAYTLRANQASEYLSEGLVVHYAHNGFSLGEALDTEVKITSYYNALNILMDKFRNTEINNYLAAKAAL